MPAAGQGNRDAVRRNIVLYCSLLFMLIGTGSVYLVVVALKPIAAEFDWPRAVPSLAYSVQYIGGGLGGILLGHWLDKAGLGFPALMGAVMIGFGSLLTSVLDSKWELYLIYGVMMGLLGRGALFSPLMANIILWFDDKRAAAVGIVGSGQALAGAVWPPIFQHFIGAIGWRDTAFWYGVFVLATMLPMVFVLKQKPPLTVAGETTAAAPEIVNSKAPLKPFRLQIILSIGSIGCCVAMSLPLAHIASHVSDLGFDPARGAEVLALMLLTATASSFFGVGFLGNRVGGLKALLIFSAIQAAILGLFTVVDNLILLYIVAALFGLGYGGILPCYPVVVRELLPPKEAGRRTGIVILFAGGGMAFGAWLGGYIFDLTGAYTAAFLIGVCFNIANLIIIASLIFRTRGTIVENQTAPA